MIFMFNGFLWESLCFAGSIYLGCSLMLGVELNRNEALFSTLFFESVSAQ